MNSETTNEMRVHIEEAVTEKGCLPIIWDVAPTSVKEGDYCTAMIRDGNSETIGTCGNFYQLQEEGTVDIVANTKRGEGDAQLRKAVSEIRFFLQNSNTQNVEYNDVIRDVPLEAEQSDYAIFLQIGFRAYTSEPIDK